MARKTKGRTSDNGSEDKVYTLNMSYTHPKITLNCEKTNHAYVTLFLLHSDELCNMNY